MAKFEGCLAPETRERRPILSVRRPINSVLLAGMELHFNSGELQGAQAFAEALYAARNRWDLERRHEKKLAEQRLFGARLDGNGGAR